MAGTTGGAVADLGVKSGSHSVEASSRRWEVPRRGLPRGLSFRSREVVRDVRSLSTRLIYWCQHSFLF